MKMYSFLAPLLLGFAANAASAFTTAFSRWWGDRRGALVTFMLRNVLGIPVWTIGLLFAAQAPSPAWFRSTIVSDVFGWLILAAGAMIILVALTTIQWRAVKPTKEDTLKASYRFGSAARAERASGGADVRTTATDVWSMMI